MNDMALTATFRKKLEEERLEPIRSCYTGQKQELNGQVGKRDFARQRTERIPYFSVTRFRSKISIGSFFHLKSLLS